MLEALKVRLKQTALLESPANIKKAPMWQRSTAIIIAGLMLLQDLSYAAPAGALVSESTVAAAISDQALSRSKTLSGIFEKLQLPLEFGKIDSVHWTNSKTTLIHIRDLHSNEQAQRKIARIVQMLSERYGVRLIQLEGASGELSHGLLSRYPDRKARVLTGRAYLREGKITGPEYLAITRNPDLILYGLEDAQLYAENRAALLKATAQSEGLHPQLTAWRALLNRLAERIFSTDLRQWLKERDEFENNRVTIAEYVRFLKKTCSRTQLQCATPQIQRLIKLEKLENRLRREGRFKTEKELTQHLELVLKEQGGIDIGIFDEIHSVEKDLETHWITPPAGLSWDLTSPVQPL